jgi:O-antigen ligase
LAGLFVFLFLVYRYLGKVWLCEKRRFVIYFLAIIAFATIVINFSSKATAVREFSGSVETNASSSAGDRAVMWLSAVEIFKDYPLTGVGLGNFSNHFSHKLSHISPSCP